MSFLNPQNLTVKVLDEGVQIANADSFDFTGAGVTGSAIGSQVTEDIPGGGDSLWERNGDVLSPVNTGDDVASYEDLITYKNFYFDRTSEPTSITATLAGLGAGDVDNGTHRYKVSYVTDVGETNLSSGYGTVIVTDKTTDGQVNVTLPISTDYRVTQRKVYRTKVGSLLAYYYVGTIADNATTSFIDTVSDASLTGYAIAAKDNFAGGHLRIRKPPFTDFQYGFLGDYNSSIGFNTLTSLTYGTGNFAMGSSVLDACTTGSNNMGMGYQTLTNLTIGQNNLAVGSYALASLVSGNRNVAIGTRAGYYNTGSGNVFIGNEAAENETGSNLLYIDNSDRVDPLVYGNFFTRFVRINGDLKANDSIFHYFGTDDDMSIYYDGTLGNIKTDLVAPSDLNIDCGTAKTIVLEVPVYDDLNFDPERSGGPVATRPAEVLINGVYHVEFDSGNSQICGAVQEVPHHYKLSTTMHPHLHLFLKSGETAGTTGVTFTIYWELRQPTGVTSGNVALSATSAELTANGNLIAKYDTTGFAGPSALEGHLALTLARTGGDAGDVVVTTYGVHYEIDTIGSRTISSK